MELAASTVATAQSFPSPLMYAEKRLGCCYGTAGPQLSLSFRCLMHVVDELAAHASTNHTIGKGNAVITWAQSLLPVRRPQNSPPPPPCFSRPKKRWPLELLSLPGRSTQGRLKARSSPNTARARGGITSTPNLQGPCTRCHPENSPPQRVAEAKLIHSRPSPSTASERLRAHVDSDQTGPEPDATEPPPLLQLHQASQMLEETD